MADRRSKPAPPPQPGQDLPGLEPKLPPSAERMMKQVKAREEHMTRRRNHRDALLRSIAILGVVGWSVVLPTLVGVAAGVWIDGRWPTRISWTLILMTAGLLAGCANAWRRIRSDRP